MWLPNLIGELLMSQPTLEERVAALEKQVAQLIANVAGWADQEVWDVVAGAALERVRDLEIEALILDV